MGTRESAASADYEKRDKLLYCPAKRIAILCLALLARLFILWFVVARFPHNWLYTRGIELGTLAQSLVAGQGLSSPFGGSTGPTALLAPGYPAIIALFFRIFGSFTFPAAIAVMGMQLLFSVTTVLLIMHVGQGALVAGQLTWREHSGRSHCRSSGCRRSFGRHAYPRCF